MSSRYTITTVVPTYNRPDYLWRALQSCVCQPHEGVRVLVCDNSDNHESSDAVARLMESHPGVEYKKRQTNIGAAENIRQGLREVHTSYFSILNDDDLLAPEFYRAGADAFRRYPDARAVLMEAVPIDENGCITTAFRRVRVEHWLSPAEGLPALLQGKIPFIWNSMLFHRDCLDIFDQALTSDDVGVDIRALMRVAARYPVVALPVVGSCITVHSGSWSTHSQHELDPRFPTWILERFRGVIEDAQVPEHVKSWASSEKAQRLGWNSTAKHTLFLIRASFQRYIRSLHEEDPRLGETVRKHLRQGGHTGVALLLDAVGRTYESSALLRRFVGSIKALKAERRKADLRRLNDMEAGAISFMRDLPPYPFKLP